MTIFRPAGGFRLIVAPAVQQIVDSWIGGDAGRQQYWNDILDRLRFTAHLEGVAEPRFPPGHRLWASAEDDSRGLPRIRLVYHVLGDRVRIRVASIG